MSKKLISFFRLSLVLAILIIALLVTAYYVVTAGNMAAQGRDEAAVTLQNAARDVQAGMSTLTEKANVLANYGDTVASFMEGTPIRRLELRDTLRMLMAMQLDMDPGLEIICVYSRDGSRMYISSNDMNESAHAASFVASERAIAEYDPALARRGVTLTRCYPVQDGVYYALLAPVYQSAGNRYLGSLILLYNGENIQSMLPEIRNGRLRVMSGGLEVAGRGTGASAAERDAPMTVPVQVNDWEAQLFPDERDLREGKLRLMQQCALVFLASGAAFALLVAVQYRRVVGPVLTLSRQVSDLGKDTGKELKLGSGVTEYDELIANINAMLSEQRRTNEEILRVRSSVYEERISFLQAQINPHFLYNCLESIRGMAGQGNLEDVREMMSCMSAVYRYCSRSETFATLREECGCAEHYARAMRLCYMHAYEVRIDMDEAALDLPVPRMILQPLLENAVRHGFRAAGRETGTIRLGARAGDGHLTLTMENDGAPVPEEVLKEWNSGWDFWRQDRGSRIGLTNVMKRLDLLYGGEARVSFENCDAGGGLRVTFVLPADASAMEKRVKNRPDNLNDDK